MKKIAYVFLALLFSGVSSFAQSDAISTYFSEYLNDENVTKIQVSGKAFELMQDVEIDGEEGEDLKKMASQVSGFRMIVEEEQTDSKSKVRSAYKKVSGQFEELIQVKEKESQVHVMINESKGTVFEVLCIIGTKDEFILASLTGNMRLSDVGNLTKSLSAVGKDVFSETSVDPTDVKIYPSPVKPGERLNLEIPEQLVGCNVRVFDASGKEVKNLNSNNSTERISTTGFDSGVYIVKFTKGDIELSKKFVVQ